MGLFIQFFLGHKILYKNLAREFPFFPISSHFFFLFFISSISARNCLISSSIFICLRRCLKVILSSCVIAAHCCSTTGIKRGSGGGRRCNIFTRFTFFSLNQSRNITFMLRNAGFAPTPLIQHSSSVKCPRNCCSEIAWVANLESRRSMPWRVSLETAFPVSF